MKELDAIYEWQNKHFEKTGVWVGKYDKAKAGYLAEREQKEQKINPISEKKETVIRKRNGYGHWMPLTEEEIDEIVMRYRNGEEPKDIAAEIGMSVTTIVNRLKERDVYVQKSFVRWTPDVTERMRTMYLNGAPMDEICRVIGCSKDSLKFKVSKLGLFKLKQKMDKEKPLRNGNPESGNTEK